MSPEDFKAWRERMSLTQEAAATILGVTRRAITYYENGTRGISETIKRLTECLEKEQ